MRWTAMLMLIVPGWLGTQSLCRADMPFVDEGDIGSELAAEWMEEAEDLTDRAYGHVKQSEYAAAEMALRDAEFHLDMALEFAVPADHPAVAYLREQLDKCRKEMEEWGGDEPAQQVAEQWWQRLRWGHAGECDRELESLVRKEEGTLTPDRTYWYPRYMTRVILPEVEMFKEKYPDGQAFFDLLPEAPTGTSSKGMNPVLSEKPWLEWTLAIIGYVHEGLPGVVERSVPEVLAEGKALVMGLEPDTPDPAFALRALDYARIALSLNPDDATAEKIRTKADTWLAEYKEKHGFDITKVRMPEDVNPDDQALHQELQAAYETWAEAQGYDDQVLRVVVTGEWRESHDAWWVENALHWGTFRRITAALAIKQPAGACRVLYCVFYRRLLAGGEWSPTRLDKVRTSSSILEENVAQ